MHCQQHQIALAFYERNIKKNTIVAIYNYQSKAHNHNIIVCFRLQLACLSQMMDFTSVAEQQPVSVDFLVFCQNMVNKWES